jgi:hypothetical protein
MALTKVPYSMINATAYNAVDYGVKSSNSSSTNQANLQELLNSMSSGGIVRFSESFSIDDKITIPYNNIIIEGDGDVTITASASTEVFYADDKSNLTVRNLKFDGVDSSILQDGLISFVSTTSSGKNIYIHDCVFTNAYQGVVCSNCSNVWVKNNEIYNFYVNGVVVSGCDNFNVDSNIIYDCDQTGAVNCYGVIGVGRSDLSKPQDVCSISFNVIKNVQSWAGIMTHDCSYMRIIGNHIENVRNGVDVSYSSAITPVVLNDFIISNNYISLTSTDTWGGASASSFAIKAIGKQATSEQVNGIIISNNIINNWNNMSGATLSGNGRAAIGLDTFNNATVTGNIIKNMDSVSGVYAGICAYNMGDTFLINDNSIRGNTKYGVAVIAATDSYLVSIADNVFHASSTYLASGRSALIDGSGTTFNNLNTSGNLTNATDKTPEIRAGTTVTYHVISYT